MILKGLVTATAAIALASAPVMAQTAAPAAPVPESETVEGSQLRGGILIPAIAIIAIIVAILVLTDDDDEDSESP